MKSLSNNADAATYGSGALGSVSQHSLSHTHAVAANREAFATTDHGRTAPMWNKPIGHPVPTRRGDPPL